MRQESVSRKLGEHPVQPGVAHGGLLYMPHLVPTSVVCMHDCFKRRFVGWVSPRMSNLSPLQLLIVRLERPSLLHAGRGRCLLPPTAPERTMGRA